MRRKLVIESEAAEGAQETVNYRQLKQAASEPSYAATGTLNGSRPGPGQKPKTL